MHFLRGLMWALLAVGMLCLGVTGMETNDPHGGVAMGNPNIHCDDAQANTELDWDPRSTEEYTCTEGTHETYKVGLHVTECEEHADKPLHVCYPRTINYTKDLPTSGAHRPLWPQYGEYTFIPFQRLLHSLEHGAIVFLYHPCADPQQIKEFKAVAEKCLRRHVISPYKKMPADIHFALLAWKCKLLLSNVDVPLIVDFVKTRARKAPEDVATNGQYNIGLIKHAAVVSDIDDSEFCPKMSVMSPSVKEFTKKSSERRDNSRKQRESLKEIMKSFMKRFTI